MRIEQMTTGVYRLPMERPWNANSTALFLTLVELRADDGSTGTGFSWTPRAGALAVQTLLDQDCRALVQGAPVHPGVLWDRLWSQLRGTGSGGITTMAIGAVDIAVWDLRAKTARVPLTDLVGRRRPSAPVYASGVNRSYPLDELVEQARRWVAAGHTRMKIKVGQPELDADVERVAAVRRVIGPDRLLMIDANQLWDVPTARRACRALARFDPYWLEEPLPADDTDGYARLRRLVDVPIAAGESLYNAYQFRDLLVAGAADYLQPDIPRVGGITPVLRIAQLARTFDVPVTPHLLPDLSAQLAVCLPLPAFVEDVEGASLAALGALRRPSGVTFGADGARPGSNFGHGLVFATDTMEPVEWHPPTDRPSG